MFSVYILQLVTAVPRVDPRDNTHWGYNHFANIFTPIGDQWNLPSISCQNEMDEDIFEEPGHH